MLTAVKQMFENIRPRADEETSLMRDGHREFVGGRWNEMGQLQFDFLIKQGLKPSHVFLDIACGSLRAGKLLIPYLAPGNYLGIDKHSEVIESGKTNEIGAGVLNTQRPEFVVSDCFSFEKFSKRPDFCIAQSLFSHLHKRDIQLCFRKLATFVRPGCKFFATFLEVSIPIWQPGRSHSIRNFFYTRRAMETFGRRWDWEPSYIGDWGHPRGQVIIAYIKR